MVLGEGTTAEDPVQAIKDVYAKGGSKDADEFLKPIIVGGEERRLKGMIDWPSTVHFGTDYVVRR